MHVTDLALNKMMGIQLPPSGDGHILELPESPLLLNHIGTVHASVQFALAEAGSGEFLLSELGEREVFAVLRTSNVKFRKPARGSLRATARFASTSVETLSAELGARGRALVSILVEIADAQGIVTMTGQYDWFLQRQNSGA